MRLRILKSFRDKLNDQVDYIAKDKPAAARRFKSDVIKRIKGIPRMPYANRNSIFFDREAFGIWYSKAMLSYTK
jgi:plasmid stabilization system protein ParE